MNTRTARVMIVALLLAVGIGAAFQFNFLTSRAQQLDRDEQVVMSAISTIEASGAELSGIAAVSAGAGDPRWSTHAAASAPGITTVVTAMRPRARSVEAAQKLQDIIEAAGHLPASTDAVGPLRTAAADLRTAEAAAFEAERGATDQQLMLIPAVVGLLWAVGLLFLLRAPAAPAVAFDAPVQAAPLAEAAPASPSAIDLLAAADLCTALSRVTSSNAIPDMLARTAALLDASGVIVWMGAGEELFAASAHGYDPRVISRLGAIPRDAENATAAAWRTGELRTVPGDMMSNGAIVAPMFGPESCIGVLAAEVRHGREEDTATRAATMMVAAQLATVLSAWPAASTTPRAAEA